MKYRTGESQDAPCSCAAGGRRSDRGAILQRREIPGTSLFSAHPREFSFPTGETPRLRKNLRNVVDTGEGGTQRWCQQKERYELGQKCSGSSGRTRTYNPSVNSRRVLSCLALQTQDLHVQKVNFPRIWGGFGGTQHAPSGASFRDPRLSGQS